MEMKVYYSDFAEVIKEVEIPIDTEKRNVIKVNDETKTVTLESVDESISFSVVQTMKESDVRDLIQLYQKILAQMVRR